MTWPHHLWDDLDPFPDEPCLVHWPLDWRGLHPQERWIWFEQLWSEVCALRDRYRLPIRAGWWANELQLEALAAFAAWVARYDSGDWDDPPGKLALLYDLERVSALLRDGADPFTPERDRPAFTRHLFALGCQPPPARDERPNGRRHDHPAGMNGYDPPPAA